MAQLKRSWQRIKGAIRGQVQSRNVDVLTGYALWAKKYPAQAHNPVMQLEETAMLALLPEVAGKDCLDLACGSGRYMRRLLELGARSVYGTDLSRDMLAQVSTTLDSYAPVCSPFLTLPFPTHTFDVITCGLGVGHEANLQRTIGEASRVLRQGGVLIYSDFHPFGALSGWQRTFMVDGITYNLEHYVHLYNHHLEACQAAGLMIDHIAEPVAGEHAPSGFETMPVILVIRAIKG